MKQELLKDIELDILQMKLLMDSASKESPDLHELLKRNILRIQGRLGQMLQEIDATLQNVSAIPVSVSPNSVSPVKVEPKENVTSVLGENIWTSTGFRRSISLNDSFRFTRDLFGGDSDLMNRVIEQVSAMRSLDAALVFLSSKVKVSEEDETMNDFVELLKKYFKSA